MYFKRIEMHGFKSFAEPVIIDFHEGVTCIVGPNGSGKSNISDALRWVLGEQSPKALRGGKMEEVIFSGTATRKSRGMAEVTLVIDNSTGVLPIDYNEVGITRRMYRSGESEYLINNNQCRLKDIRELIMDTGIGVDGYSLIGQGKIAEIVSNKPESRREIFEEAAGVVLYKTKKQEAERKLDTTLINLDRANDIIWEIEGRIDSLKSDSENAKEALELREIRKDLEINITLKNMEKIYDSNDFSATDIEELVQNIEENKKKQEEIESQILIGREKKERLQEIGTEKKDRLIKLVEEIGQITNKKELDSEKIASFNKDEERLNNEIFSLRGKLEKEIEHSEVLYQNMAEIEDKVKSATEELSKAIDEYNHKTAQSMESASRVSELKNDLMELNSQVFEKNSEIKSYEGYRESLTKRIVQLKEEKETLKKDKLSKEDTLREREKELQLKEEDFLRIADRYNEEKSRENILIEKKRALLKTGEEIRINSSQLVSRKQTILEMEANYEGYSGAVKFIMGSNLKGILGVVSELITVPKGYETAIETALGSGMQNIVCNLDDDAKTAINSLKNSRAGRLTFLPLESVRAGKVNIPHVLSTSRGFLGMAKDILSYDSKFGDVINYLVGRVAVVDNMDTAVKLSKISGGLRFVTLEGEIINSGGAITGGRYKNRSGNLLSRKNEIEALTEKISQLKAETQKNEAQITDINEKLAEILLRKENTEKEIQNKRSLLSDLKVGYEALKRDFEGQEETAVKAEREISNIEKDIEDTDILRERLKNQLESINSKISSIEKQLDEEAHMEKVIKEEILNVNDRITKARVNKTSLDSKIQSEEVLLQRVLDAIDEYTEQIDEKEDTLEKLLGDRNALSTGTYSTDVKVEDLIKDKKETERYIETLNLKADEVQLNLNRLEAERRNIADNLNSIIDQKQQQEIRLAKNEAGLEALKEKLWSEFEISHAQALAFKRDDFVLSSGIKESRRIKNRLEELGEINIGAIKEYEEVKERYEFLTEQRKDIIDASTELKKIINDMDSTIKKKFKETFNNVVMNFEVIFKELFGGGHAELSLDNEDNPLEAGIEITAQPPGKKLQNINLMSGGEKTMTAIALMFAVLKTKPTPFCILDEVEAALDDANIDRFAKYLKNFNEIQFTIVTHQKKTMEHADVLYGVTMAEQGVSKVLSLRLGDDFQV